jgi:hypothetical protein
MTRPYAVFYTPSSLDRLIIAFKQNDKYIIR